MGTFWADSCLLAFNVILIGGFPLVTSLIFYLHTCRRRQKKRRPMSSSAVITFFNWNKNKSYKYSSCNDIIICNQTET